MVNITSSDGTLETASAGLVPAVSIETIGMAILVLIGGFITNKISNYAISKWIDRKSGGEHARKSAKRLTGYIIYPLTLVGVLSVFGVPLSALGTVVGLIGLGISFALKDIIANFISGLLILINQPIKIGDQIEVGGEEGTVKDIKTRATDLKTYDGRKVIVPNSDLYSNMVINNTGYGKRRFNVIVGISYDDDIEKAKELAEKVLDEAESVDSEPAPQVLVDELGGSSVNLKLRGWTDNQKSNIVSGASEVTELIKNKYDDAGIDIPYPIRTVYMENEE